MLCKNSSPSNFNEVTTPTSLLSSFNMAGFSSAFSAAHHNPIPFILLLSLVLSNFQAV